MTRRAKLSRSRRVRGAGCVMEIRVVGQVLGLEAEARAVRLDKPECLPCHRGRQSWRPDGDFGLPRFKHPKA